MAFLSPHKPPVFYEVLYIPLRSVYWSYISLQQRKVVVLNLLPDVVLQTVLFVVSPPLLMIPQPAKQKKQANDAYVSRHNTV